MLALSTNSPFLRGHPTGMMSSRIPVYRALPARRDPPHFGSWDVYSSRVEVMMRAGAIKDYTYLWWDVRPHPNLGTVEVRVFDQQTRVELHDRARGAHRLDRPPAELLVRRRRRAGRVPDRAGRRQQGPRRGEGHGRRADGLLGRGGGPGRALRDAAAGRPLRARPGAWVRARAGGGGGAAGREHRRAPPAADLGGGPGPRRARAGAGRGQPRLIGRCGSRSMLARAA